MSNVGNWIVESCNTVGVSNLNLTGADIGFAKFRDAVPAGDVWYAILDGDDREAGVGYFNGIDTITRFNVHATLSNGAYNGTNPTPLSLSGVSTVACTFNATAYRDILTHMADTNNPHNVVASQIQYNPVDDPTSDELSVQDALVDHGSSIEERVPSMSGVISGGRITINNTTQFTVSAGSGTIYDNTTDPSNTEVLNITWLDHTNVTILPQGLTAGPIRLFITATGNVLQISGAPSPDLWRENIFLGAVFFVDNILTDVAEAPAIVKQTATDAYDLMTKNITIDGSEIEPVTDELQIWIREGMLFYPCVNWYNDRHNPNFITLPDEGGATTPIPMHTMTRTGLIGSQVTTIPTEYNPSGDTLDNLSGNDATIHRLYSVGIGSGRAFVLLYGQQEYSNAQIAKDNLRQDEDLTTFPLEAPSMLFLGWVCVEGSAPDFNDVNDAWIVSGSGQSVGSTSASTDHTVLTNRNALNQHPIESIGTSLGEQLRDTLDGKVRWMGTWLSQDYVTNDMVRDGNWTMIANTDTSKRPAPQPIGEAFYVFQGDLIPTQTTAKNVIFGNRYTVSAGGYLNGYRVDTVKDNHYKMYLVLDPNGIREITLLQDFFAPSDGWQEFNIVPIILSGVEFDILAVEYEPSPTPITWTGNWNYTTPNNANVPGTGTISQADKLLGELRINKTDDDGGDRETELLALTAGDIINGAGMSWSIQAIADSGNVVNFTVAPAQQGTPDGTQEFSFETVAETPISYGIDTDYWLTNTEVQGLFTDAGDYSTIVPNDNAYGTDILVQQATVSDDWDLVALSGGSGGSGGSTDAGLLPTAWALIDGISDVFIGTPFNMSTIISDGAGHYNVTFDIPVDNTDYIIIVTPSSGNAVFSAVSDSAGKTVNGFGFYTFNNAGSPTDCSSVGIQIFGGKD